MKGDNFMGKILKKMVSLFLVVLMFVFNAPISNWLGIDNNAIKASALTSAKMDVVLVVDVSGSMSGTSNTNAKAASKAICEDIFNYSSNARIGIISFANSATTYSFSTDKAASLAYIDGLGASGGTYMTNGLNAAHSLMQKADEYSAKSVVIISDGALSDSVTSAQSAANTLKAYCNVISVGINTSSSTASTLESLANQGYYSYSGGAISSSLLESLRNGYTAPAFSEDQQQIINSLAFDINTILSNIDLSGGALDFPSLPIKGENRDMGSLEASISLPLGANLTYTVDLNEKRIKILIGLQDDQSAVIGSNGQATTYWSEAYKDVKNMYQNVTGKKVDTTKLWNQFSSIRGQLKKLDCSMGINVSAKIAGYVELDYSSNELKFQEGGVILAVDSGVVFNSNTYPYPGVFVGFGITPEIGGTLKLSNENNVLIFGGSVYGDLSAYIELGIGEPKIVKTYIKAGVEGTIGASYSFPATSLAEGFSAYLSAKAYAKSEVFGFDVYSDNWDLGRVELYPKKKSRMLMSTIEDDIINNSTELLKNATSLERDYSVDMQSANEEFILEDIYYDSAPQLLKLNDGNLMLIWTGDDGTKNEENRSSIFYSVYNGHTWSLTESISNNDCYNSSPVAIENDGCVYVVWQRTSTPISSSEDLTEVLPNVDLYYSVYNNGTFTQEKKVTDNNVFAEMSHSIVASPDGLEIIWIENSENNIYASTGTNSLKKATILSDGSVTETEIIVETQLPFGDYVGFNNGEFNIAYTIASSGLDRMYFYSNGNSEAIYESQLGITSVHFDGKQIMFAEGTQIGCIDIENKVSTILSEDYYLGAKFYSIGDRDFIINTEKVNKEYYINLIEYNQETKELSDVENIFRTDKYIVDYDVALDDNSEYVIALNTCCFDIEATSMFSNYSLSVNRGQEYNEIFVNEFAWCHDEISSLNTNDNAIINFEVYNTGTTDIDSLYYTITDSDSGSLLQTGEISDAQLLQGESKKYSINYPIPEGFAGCNLRIDVAIEETEMSIEDNYATLTLGLSDLLLYDIDSSYIDGEVYVNCKVKNIGYAIAKDLHFCAYNQGKSGTLIYETDLDDLDYNEEREVSFILPSNYCASIYDEELCSIELSVNCSNLEESNHNNEDVFVYDNLLPFEFEINSFEEGITINKYIGTSSLVNIPAVIGGAEVKNVAANAFNNTAVEEINIPVSVTSIASNAFVGANNLEDINVDSNNAYYASDDGVLYNKNKDSLLAYPLAKVIDVNFKAPLGVTKIGKYAFYSNKNIVSFDTIGITTIDDYAFYNSSLSVCVFDDATKTIGSYAFANTTNLTQIDTNQVTSILSYAFNNSALIRCTIGESVASIGIRAFNCQSLKDVNYNSVDATYGNILAILMGYNCFSNVVENIIIGEGVTHIPQGIFKGTSISEIVMPNSVISIGSYAFSNCSALTDISFSENLNTISSSAFSSCSSIEKISLPKTVTSLGSYTFSNCTSLKYIDIPKSITAISDYTFNNCSAIENISIPNTVVTIGSSAFLGCSKLNGVTLPEALTSIGSSAFSGCSSLTSIKIPETVTSISDNTFANCTALKKIEIPYQITTIGETPLKGCSKVVVWCYNNSVAYEYVVANSIKYKIMELNADDLVVTGIQETFIDSLQYQLSAEIAPIYTDEKIVWSSSDSKVFTVSNTGLLTAKGAGEAILTVASSRGSVSKTFTINVLGLSKDSENTNLYHARNADDMLALSTMVNSGVSFAGKIIQLDNDIDLSNVAWTPIGTNSTYAFSGVFDGNNRTISGLNYETTSNTYAGLFGYIKTGGIKNLTVEGSVNGKENVGIFAGCILDSALYNCKAIGEVKRIASGNYGYVGGLVGSALHSVIINCAAETDITVDFGSSNIYYAAVGGIAGVASTSGSEPMCILNSYCIGDISVNGNNYYYSENYYVGGIAGYLKDDAANNYYFGEITNADEDPIKKIGYAFGCVVPEYTSESDYNGIGTIIVQDNYYLEGKNAIGLISEGDYDSTNWTSAISEDNFSILIGDGSLVDELNGNKGSVEEIIVAHRDILSNSTWAELVDRINGDSFTVSSWKIGAKNLPVNYECDCYRHAESDWIVDVEATCTNEGSKHTYCLACQEIVTTSVIEKAQHKFSEWTETKAATCTEKGSESRTCTSCSTATETRDIDKLGHKFEGDWTTDKAPTCTKGGSESRVCTRCKSAKETRTVEKLGHDFENKWTVDKEATCLKTGSKSHHCSRCDEKSDVTVINKLAHSYKESVQEATCTKDGNKTYNCSSCGDSYSEVIAAKGHVDKNGDQKCDNCDYIYDNTCDHMCHKSGFNGFIWKIVRFFWKLFKMNPVCECGVAHY